MIKYSQRDPQWSEDILGFARDESTIGKYGCLLTSSAMVLTHYGFSVSPKELNELLKNKNGFMNALMRTGVLSFLFPVDVSLRQKDNSLMKDIDRHLSLNMPVIVELDFSPSPGYQNHWIVLESKTEDTYFIADPWAVNPGEETVTLKHRYGFGGESKKIIQKALFIVPRENATEQINSEPIAMPQKIQSGFRFATVVQNLRLRNGPSIDAVELLQLPVGTKLTSAGDHIVDGNIVWQPAIVYVAASQDGKIYIKPEN